MIKAKLVNTLVEKTCKGLALWTDLGEKETEAALIHVWETTLNGVTVQFHEHIRNRKVGNVSYHGGVDDVHFIVGFESVGITHRDLTETSYIMNPMDVLKKAIHGEYLDNPSLEEILERISR